MYNIKALDLKLQQYIKKNFNFSDFYRIGYHYISQILRLRLVDTHII